MEDLLIAPWQLAVLFFFVSLLYSSVGLAGGSSYTALLAIFGIHFKAIPLITLSLNLLVSSLGTYNYFRHSHGRLGLVLP
ncbi:MAG: sulfite exporter TauE/SafE family protein, partial [Desulfobulbaceae bacterium]|nr:sulfite exporter TauE/SafE family protein [Candidatus Desulfobia pelagia]